MLFVSVFQDINTDMETIQHPVVGVHPLPGHVFLDSTIFTSALQVTVQTSTFEKVQSLHDNLVALCPIIVCCCVVFLIRDHLKFMF